MNHSPFYYKKITLPIKSFALFRHFFGSGRKTFSTAPETIASLAKMRVAVVGAGSAGLAVLRHIPRESGVQVVCFEKSSHSGGQWKYSYPKQGSNSNSSPENTSSLYQNLVTNLPTLVMQYPDFPWISDSSYIHHSQVLKYLDDYCESFGLSKFIRFNCAVQNISRTTDCSGKTLWHISFNDENGVTETGVFDYVFACVGHFSYPRFMPVKGLDSFTGKVLHSKEYDDPKEFKGQKVLLIGRGNSSIDICVELMEYCDTVVVSSNCPGTTFDKYNRNVKEVDLVTAFADGYFYCKDVLVPEVFDTVMFCTGYTYDLPFLDYKSCDLEVNDGIISPLYKFTIHAKHPSMFFIGLNQRICPFPLYYYQAAYSWSTIAGGTKLPDNLLQVAEDVNSERLKDKKERHFFYLTGKEEYLLMKEFAEAAGLEGPKPWFPQLRAALAEMRTEDPVNYKHFKVNLTADQSKVNIFSKSGKLVCEVENSSFVRYD